MVITQKPSPNFDSNRVTIDRILIHWIVGNLSTADAQFAKPNSTSAHYGIENNEVHQYVQENKVAYHAGNYPFNQRSIGIEHSAAPDRPATEETYKTSGQLVREIAARYNIPLDRQHIMRHSEVVATQCCGTIDIDKIISYAKQGTQPPMDNEAKLRLRAKVSVDNILNYLRDTKLRDQKGEQYVENAASELWLDTDSDPKFLGLMKRIFRDYAGLQITGYCSPAELAKAKEEGRKQGRQEIKDIVKGLA